MPNRNNVPKERLWFKSWPRLLPRWMDFPETTLFELAEESARRFPSKSAIIYYGKVITYGELLESILKFATYLKGIGIRKGDRVAINLPNSPHFVVAFYGTMRANAIVVSTDPMLNAEGLKLLIDDCQSKLLVTMARSLSTMGEIRGEGIEKIIA